MASTTGATRPMGYNGPKRQFNEQLQRNIRRKRKSLPAGETPRDKFIRLATSRVTTAVQSIRLVGNLANRHVYRYEDEDVQAIRTTVMAALDEALSQFAPRVRQPISLKLAVTKSVQN